MMRISGTCDWSILFESFSTCPLALCDSDHAGHDDRLRMVRHDFLQTECSSRQWIDPGHLGRQYDRRCQVRSLDPVSFERWSCGTYAVLGGRLASGESARLVRYSEAARFVRRSYGS
jgi:hypothetical protein